jgi:cleavage stimulation factor subunit 3
VNAAKLFSDEAAAVYERATASLLKKNMLLYFAYADFEEGRLKYEKVHQIYSRYLDITDIDPTLVSANKCYSFFIFTFYHAVFIIHL